MADNTDEEQLDNPTNTQSENSPDEIIPTNDTETINPNQETENMEVHHHPDLHHKPKKWKQYFLEFLMIFLAVTLGFFAEGYREHLTERAKEKEYMKEIVENLKYDVIRCDKNSDNNVEITKGLDSARVELVKAIDGNINGNALYYFILRYAGDFGQAVFNTSTITELKNSGSLRLIDNRKLVSDLADYYERQIFAANDYMPTKQQTDALQKETNELISLVNLDDYIMSFKNNKGVSSSTYNFGNILNHQPVFKLINGDPKVLHNYYNQISLYEMQISRYNFWLFICKEAAEKLITDINKEYHFE